MTLTQRIFDQVATKSTNNKSTGMGSSASYSDLQRADAVWKSIRDGGPAPPPQVVTAHATSILTAKDDPFDIVICGGTLGIILATALQARGIKTAVVERGKVVGRDQEWNISKRELQTLTDQGVLTKEQVQSCIASEWDGGRAAFHGSPAVKIRGVLDVGVAPRTLLATLLAKYRALGGTLYEDFSIDKVDVYRDAAVLSSKIKTRLVVDCMGHASPLVRQARQNQRPDGICLVVGSVASGFDPASNTTCDIILTNEPSRVDQAMQFFWEAFPAYSISQSARTTYLFTYIDAASYRPSLEALFDQYWSALESYQSVQLDQLSFERLLFGVLPTYRDSPLHSKFDRLVHVGDASGVQSPLSFGGFGALLRHLPRLVTALDEALQCDALDAKSLALLHPYLPNLSACWLFQHAMSLRANNNDEALTGEAIRRAQTSTPTTVSSSPRADFINRLMGGSFQAMKRLGSSVMLPFLQDNPSPLALARLLSTQMKSDPAFVASILTTLSPVALADWLFHYSQMIWYNAGDLWVSPSLLKWAETEWERGDKKKAFVVRRWCDAWKFGSGADYH